VASKSMRKRGRIAISSFVKAVGEFNIIIMAISVQYMGIVKRMEKLIIIKLENLFRVLWDIPNKVLYWIKSSIEQKNIFYDV
jgi:Na+-transporting methylmalonyl-CoA/oxaloacetate decarboxylase beta subunit